MKENVAQQSGLSCLIAFMLFSGNVLAHKGHSHVKEEEKKPIGQIESERLAKTYAEIRTSYERDVAPIFKRSCFDCHSSETQFPWYSNLPIVRTLIEDDIAEARKHLDMTQGFPFKGHASVIEDIKAVEDAVRGKTMPPLNYRIIHPGAGLSDSDREKVFNWTRQTLERLRKEEKPQPEL